MGRELILGNVRYDVEELVGVSLTTVGMALLFRNGSYFSTIGNTPAEYYAILDMCPWASRSIA